MACSGLLHDLDLCWQKARPIQPEAHRRAQTAFKNLPTLIAEVAVITAGRSGWRSVFWTGPGSGRRVGSADGGYQKGLRAISSPSVFTILGWTANRPTRS
jgi:hypothetical protein